jgi:hypothetical protein
MGLSVLRIASPQQRDRRLLLNPFAVVLPTAVGAAEGNLGKDDYIEVHAAKHRTHSLFRQNCMLNVLIPQYAGSQPRDHFYGAI